jgi:uncharacterized secreted protein with C-terminal beta-propeller domain
MKIGAIMILRRKLGLLVSLASTFALAVGCSGGSDQTVGPNSNIHVFESDPPGDSTNGSRGDLAAGDSAAPNASESTPTVDGGGGSDAKRAIEEADIFKIEGKRLYALSQYGGLNVIDISERDNMRLLGRKQISGSPFEMYVRDSIVFALYNGFGEYVKGDMSGEWSWIQTSYVVAFDTTDATHPQIIGKFPVPGQIQDSRIVGDILYVVGYESNGCWNCEEGQHTTVLSLDVADPQHISRVDRLSFADDLTDSYSWKRSITVTDKRMYVAGPEWGNSGPVGSTVQLIDISDPKGDLVEGTKVQVAGSVNSRWQMDEYNGVLRVISQPGMWSMTDTARIQTYQVDSAQSVKKLANVAMTIPVNESLRSVRFDGSRAYAITAEQMDPLFTIDLSDPTKPRQAGELEMPGWIYHMEPRGNRVVSLGYDQTNENGALAVSLFDVTDLGNPKMLDRVNFGGDWAWIGEDQDRVQKAFQVLDESKLILMPFSGWEYDDETCYSGGYNNGIQLIDWNGDDLNLGGVAKLIGQPRRGFLHDERLFAISEERVETFDITNRTKPVKKDSLKTAHYVNSTIAAGNTIVKVSQDWYSNTISLDTTTLENVELPDELGHIDLALQNNSCESSSIGTIAASKTRVYIVINSYNYSKVNGGTSQQTSRLVTLDVSSPKAPKVIGDAQLNFGEGWSYWYIGNLVNAGVPSVAIDNTFAMLSTRALYDSLGSYENTETVAHILDVTNPNKPVDKAILVDGKNGTTGLFADGSTIAFGYYKPSPSQPDRVRFYVDRINVADPSAPKQLGPVNVPGAVIAYNSDSDNVATVDYKTVTYPGITQNECSEKYGSYDFEYANGVYVENGIGDCHQVQQSVYLSKLKDNSATVLGSKSLAVGQQVSQVAAGSDRLFMTTNNGYGYRYLMLDCMGCGYTSFEESKLPLLVLGGLASDEYALGKIDLESGNYWGYAPMAATADRVLLATGWNGKLVVVDGKNPEKPSVLREVETTGNAAQLTISKGIGIASLYNYGVKTIPVAD